MEPFKNAVSPELIELTGELLAREVAGIDPKAFAAPLVARLEALELKQRVMMVADALHEALPDDADRRRSAILAMLHPDDAEGWNGSSTLEGLRGWGIWPLTDMIGRYGLGSLGQALETLRELTKRGTSEFDVRPFIAADPDQALAIIAAWVNDPNHHVRRLVSEGTRPRLPWGMRLHDLVANPKPMLPVLQKLRDDPSDYVRRSVANHLNDIAKDHPELVSEVARDWMQNANPNRKKLLRHACRTLIKEGHANTLATFGFARPEIAKPAITVKADTVRFGNALEFETAIRATGKTGQNVILDYIIHHRKADGTLSPKVFKWTTFKLAPGETKHLKKRHVFKPITTRRYYPGTHALSLRINGSDHGYEVFTLEITDSKKL